MCQAVRKGISERIRAKDAEINEVKAEQSQQRAVLEGMRTKEDAEMGDIPGMLAEKERIFEEIKATKELVNTMRAEYKVKEDAWWANEKLLRSQQRDEKQKKCVGPSEGPAQQQAAKNASTCPAACGCALGPCVFMNPKRPSRALSLGRRRQMGGDAGRAEDSRRGAQEVRGGERC